MFEMGVCDHVHKGKFTTSRIGDREVRVEICSDCGIAMVHPEDARTILSAPRKKDAVTLDSKKLILALLGAFPKRPIFNRTVLMKEIFLFKKETASDIGIWIRGANFAPYNYGPHSREVSDKLDELVRDGVVLVEKDPDSGGQIIRLTERGMEEAQNILSHFNEEQVAKLRSKRKAWDQLGYRGILEKVYVEYPAYRVRSRIAKDVEPKRRWNEEPK